MQEPELDALRHLTPPDPHPAAKARAIAAARAQFEQTQQHEQKKITIFAKIFQGSAIMLRPIAVIHQHIGELLMKKHWMAGTALAGIVAVGISVMIGGQELLHTQTAEQEVAGTTIESAQANKVLKNIEQPAVSDSKKEDDQTYSMDAAVASAPPAAAVEESSMELAAAKPLMQSRRAMDAGVMAQLAPEGAASAGYVGMDDAVMLSPPYMGEENRDRFDAEQPNSVKKVSEEPVSTFSIDVDTASYSVVRSSLNNGSLPPKAAVRIEEMINYFDYDYPVPESREEPFKPVITVYPTPWNKNTQLLHIGIKGHEIQRAEKPKSNLVFLIDVSGSMQDSHKLPLLKNAFRLMVENLAEDDTVAIVTYAGNAGTVLEPTKVKDKAKILAALENLYAGGSTAGAEGIKQAYALAEQHVDPKGVNRVMLATDGDFNVGITDQEELKSYIERKRESGIFLSVLGFGRGNYNDALMQTLAQHGNGNAAYIDTLNEARKVLVEEAASTLYPIAKDVKVQIEFNPEQVAEYRLIGYETRMLQREDFNNDKVDAGDIGAGHTVTALYEITPKGSEAVLVDDLRYQQAKPAEAGKSYEGKEELAFLKLRYKLPERDNSKLISLPVTQGMVKGSIADTSADVRFATAVAAFGQLLRGEYFMGAYNYDEVIALAQKARGEDAFGYRSEFLNLVRLAKSAQPM